MVVLGVIMLIPGACFFMIGPNDHSSQVIGYVIAGTAFMIIFLAMIGM
jgi:hypothetical protein